MIIFNACVSITVTDLIQSAQKVKKPSGDFSLFSSFYVGNDTYLVSDFREGRTVLHVPPFVHVSLLLYDSELLLGPPQFVGQCLELSEPAQQLPSHLLLLPLQAQLHLPRLLLCHFQLQAILLRFQTNLVDLEQRRVTMAGYRLIIYDNTTHTGTLKMMPIPI